MFDTVFTSIGSTTQIFRVHNPNNGEVNISSIRLARGSSSFYRLNVDGATGTAGKIYTNVQIAAKDSMYIFVQVTINPNYDPVKSPFIYRDSIIFELNGNTQYFNLTAFGQNAYYHFPTQIITNFNNNTQAIYYSLDTNVNGAVSITWKNDKPHLIYGFVVVDSLHHLTISANTHIYVHNTNGGSGIWVYRHGTIQINPTGTSTTTAVTFQGDRLEQEYKDVPGQWGRIWINEGSANNIINYAIIKNAFIGVQASYSTFDGSSNNVVNFSMARHLTISNTIIQNCSRTGVFGYFYTITGDNNVVVNCGQNILEFDDGGSYSFHQCTFANYWNQTNNSTSSSARTTPSFNFNNYNGSQILLFDTLHFGNCIFDGTLAEEFNFDTLAQSGGFTTPYSFDHCTLKTGLLSANSLHTYTCQVGQPSLSFDNPSAYNFDISQNNSSAAYQKGGTNISAKGGYTVDINGHTPTGTFPNIGAYQQ